MCKQTIDFEDFQTRVGEWAEKTFPYSTFESITTHLLREMIELAFVVGLSKEEILRRVAEATDKPIGRTWEEESADVTLLLLHLAYKAGFSLFESAGVKHAVNQGRLWGTPDHDGVVEHVQP